MAIRVPAELVERDPEIVAQLAGLVYWSDDRPGYRRRPHGRGFTYLDLDGSILEGLDRQRAVDLVIPPAWREVWISPEPLGHLQATGFDDADRKQYRYHDDFRAFADQRKYARLQYFGRALVEIRRRCSAAFESTPGERDYAVAAAITLIDRCLLRVGNDRSASDGHYGATTLTVDHVVDDSYVRLEYEGKSGAPRSVVIEDDDLADILVDLASDADDELFWFRDAQEGARRRASAADINRFIVESVGPAFSAKDFRTWGGSTAALRARIDGANEVEAVDEAAEELGNTRAVARSSYIHPLVFEAPDDVVEDAWRRSRASRWMERTERTLHRVLNAESVRSTAAPVGSG